MVAAVWVLLWAEEAPTEAQAQARAAVQAERLEHVVLRPHPVKPLAPELLRQAINRYQQMRFADARTAYDEAITEAVATGAAGLGATELSDLFVGRALAVEATGGSGFDDMVRAAQIGPTRLLDPGRLPPSALREFERAQEAVRESPRGTLVVETVPGAAVFLDGDPAGSAPLRVESLPYGEHLVRVEAPGRLPVSARVVHENEETRVRLEGDLAGPPALAAVVGEAKAREVSTALIVTVVSGSDVLVERVDVDAGRVNAVERTETAELRSSLRRMLQPEEPPSRVRPAVWLLGGAAAGAVITTLIFLLQGDDDGGGTVPSVDPGSSQRPP